MGIDAGAHSGTAQRQCFQRRKRLLKTRNIFFSLRRPGTQRLTHADRHRIHQVSTTCLNKTIHLFSLAANTGGQVVQRRQQGIFDLQRGTDVDNRWNHIVTALTVVDVVVRAHRLTGFAAGQRRQNFVGVHVRAGAGACLENIDRKVLHQIIFRQQTISGFSNGLPRLCWNLLQLLVRYGSRFFQGDQCPDIRFWHACITDWKVVDRTLGLSGIQSISGNLQFPHAVFFCTHFTHTMSPLVMESTYGWRAIMTQILMIIISY